MGHACEDVVRRGGGGRRKPHTYTNPDLEPPDPTPPTEPGGHPPRGVRAFRASPTTGALFLRRAVRHNRLTKPFRVLNQLILSPCVSQSAWASGNAVMR